MVRVNLVIVTPYGAMLKSIHLPVDSIASSALGRVSSLIRVSSEGTLGAAWSITTLCFSRSGSALITDSVSESEGKGKEIGYVG